jgi:hypothetical protein
MLRLTQPAPTGRLDVGWLVEVDVADGEALAAEHGLDDVLRDMRLLGLQPTVFRTKGHPTTDAVDRMCDDSFPASDPPSVWTWDVSIRPQQEQEN